MRRTLWKSTASLGRPATPLPPFVGGAVEAEESDTREGVGLTAKVLWVTRVADPERLGQHWWVLVDEGADGLGHGGALEAHDAGRLEQKEDSQRGCWIIPSSSLGGEGQDMSIDRSAGRVGRRGAMGRACPLISRRAAEVVEAEDSAYEGPRRLAQKTPTRPLVEAHLPATCSRASAASTKALRDAIAEAAHASRLSWCASFAVRAAEHDAMPYENADQLARWWWFCQRVWTNENDMRATYKHMKIRTSSAIASMAFAWAAAQQVPETLGRYQEALERFGKIERGHGVGFAAFNLWMYYVDPQRFAASPKRFEQGIPLLEQGLQRNTAVPHGLNAVGYAYASLQMLQEAQDWLAKGLEYDPDNPVIWNNIAAVWMLAGAFQNAAQGLEKALTLEPSNPMVVHNVLLLRRAAEPGVGSGVLDAAPQLELFFSRTT
ncbi:unnamed protein product [Prorocentrum cordatum]|uniref:Tetratricopeptide repeat protein 38 n=1 Tax=Prorocentrum cordatum TaxID=2364126 RepID=A0ABN9U6S0_9DINO|nr:unnamed protein product [Polarella glacialis]